MLAGDAANRQQQHQEQQGGREGRDDGVKMAARVRVPLPLRGQENIQRTNESETRRRISWEPLTEVTPIVDDIAAA